MRRLLGLTLLSLLAAPLAVRADGSIQLTARGGVAKPFGETANGAKLADGVAWAFPLEAQLQFRVTKQLAIGAYGRYAPTTLASDLSDACSAANVSCGVTDIGFGALAEYRFRERLEGGPWLGASFGWEMLKSRRPHRHGEGDVDALRVRGRRLRRHRLRARRPHPRAVRLGERGAVLEAEGGVGRDEHHARASATRRSTAGSASACGPRCCSRPLKSPSPAPARGGGGAPV